MIDNCFFSRISNLRNSVDDFIDDLVGDSVGDIVDGSAGYYSIGDSFWYYSKR